MRSQPPPPPPPPPPGTLDRLLASMQDRKRQGTRQETRGAASMVNLREAARLAGISEGLLILWISTGKFTPSCEIAGVIPGEVGPAFGWNRFSFTDEDVARLRVMTEKTAEKRTRVEQSHRKGTYYSVKQVAEMWGVGVDKIRELFENEKGVIKIKNPARRGKRTYTTLKISEAAELRVRTRLAE